MTNRNIMYIISKSTEKYKQILKNVCITLVKCLIGNYGSRRCFAHQKFYKEGKHKKAGGCYGKKSHINGY